MKVNQSHMTHLGEKTPPKKNKTQPATSDLGASFWVGVSTKGSSGYLQLLSKSAAAEPSFTEECCRCFVRVKPSAARLSSSAPEKARRRERQREMDGGAEQEEAGVFLHLCDSV